jgi:hypothetical protein
MNTNVNRSPYLDGLAAKEEFNNTLPLLETIFGECIRVGRSQVFKFENDGNPIIIRIASAPSNSKVVGEMKSVITSLKDKSPFYTFFTRDVKTYPESKETYYDKLKSLYKLRKPFKGAIMGIDELKSQNVIDTIKNGQLLPLNLNRYKDIGGEISLERALMEQFGITAKKAKEKAEAIKVLLIK